LANELKNEPLAKIVWVVRQAHHEREKGNDFNPTSVRPELVEGHFLTFARVTIDSKGPMGDGFINAPTTPLDDAHPGGYLCYQ
jgi:hypothetical protein